MRRLALLLVPLALALAACGNPCQDLGSRICSCSGGGTTSDACRQQIQNLLSDAGVSTSDEAFCSSKLDTCKAPTAAAGQPEILFCEWITTTAGKVACGLANPTGARPDAPAP